MMDSNEFIDKVKILNLKKGDVLVVKYEDYENSNKSMPRDVWVRKMKIELENIKSYFKDEGRNKLGVIFVPNTIDFEVIRLEEWFV